MTFDELQQVGSVQEKQDRSKDRTLRDSKVDCRWHRPSLCELVVFGRWGTTYQLMTFSPRRTTCATAEGTCDDRRSRMPLTGRAESASLSFRNPALIRCPTGLWEWPSPSSDALYTPTECGEADHCPWSISEAACWPVVPAAWRWRTD